MANAKSSIRGIRDAKIELDDAAILLGKDRTYVERLIDGGRLAPVSGNGQAVTVSLLDVVEIRHEWWESIREMALAFVSAFEDESLVAMLEEVRSQRTARHRATRMSEGPTKRYEGRRSRRPAANDAVR